MANFIALYYDDKTYLVNETPVPDSEMEKILNGQVDVLLDVDINVFKDFEPFSTMPYVYTVTANVVKYENMSSQYKHVPEKLTKYIGTLYQMDLETGREDWLSDYNHVLKFCDEMYGASRHINYTEPEKVPKKVWRK